MSPIAQLLGLVTMLDATPGGAAPAIAAPRIEHAQAADAGLPGDAFRSRDAARDRAWVLTNTQHSPARQAVVARLGAARLDPQAPVAADGRGRDVWLQLGVAEVREQRVRVVITDADVTLLVWVDAGDLAPQLQHPAAIAGGAAGSRSSVELAPGEIVHVEAARGDRRRVRTRDGLRGWVDVDALGPTFVPMKFEAPKLDRPVRGRMPVFDRPGGARLPAPETDREATTWVHAVGPTEHGWTPIEYVPPCRRTLRIRGWVHTATPVIRMRPPTVRCGLTVRVGPVKPGVPPTRALVLVRADTELVDERGELVGRVRRDHRVAVGDDGALRIATVWGPMRVWVGATLGPPSPRTVVAAQ